MARFSFFLILLFGLLSDTEGMAQSTNWHSMEEVVNLQKRYPKKILVHVMTEWCRVCRKMEQTTFNNPELIEELSRDYYLVSFDAQQRDEIVLNGKTYGFFSTQACRGGGYNQLAYEMTYGNLVFPTLVFLDEAFQVLQAIEGYQGAEKLSSIGAYFAKDYHKTTPWTKYIMDCNKRSPDISKFQAKREGHSID